MKKSVAMKWVKALRSGKYRQGKGRLKSEWAGTHCCLGVLCELSGLSFEESAGGVPPLVQEVAGMKSSVGWIDKAEGDALYRLNDGLNGDEYSFDEIADIIQLCWEEL